MQTIKKERKQSKKSTGSYIKTYNAATGKPPAIIKNRKRKWIYGGSNL